MKVIATRQLHSQLYGNRLAGEEFDVPHYIATELLKAKLVREPDTYEVKAIQPSSTQPHSEHPEPKLSNKRK